MSQALFVSESVACLWSNFLYTNYNHRPSRTCRRPLAHFLCLICAPVAQRFQRVPTRHDGFYAHLIWLCPHETHGSTPTHLIVFHRNTMHCITQIQASATSTLWSASGFSLSVY